MQQLDGAGPPVSGVTVAVLAGLWGGLARAAMLTSFAVPAAWLAALNAAVLWALCLVLAWEGIRGAAPPKIWAYVAFLLLAGGVSGGLVSFAAGGAVGIASGPALAPLLFAALLIVVGGRMAYGFLKSDASRRGWAEGGADSPVLGGWVGAAALGGAAALCMILAS